MVDDEVERGREHEADVHQERADEHEVVAVVAPSDAVVEPRAVVIERLQRTRTSSTGLQDYWREKSTRAFEHICSGDWRGMQALN